AVEMGRVFLCGLLMVTAIGAFSLFKCSFSRSSAYAYPALGAGASVSLVILGFAEDSPFDLHISLLIAALFGLAFAQGLSCTSRDDTFRKLQELEQEARGRTRSTRLLSQAVFNPKGVRVVLAGIGFVLAAQAVWALSQSWYFGDGLPITSIASSSEAFSKT